MTTTEHLRIRPDYFTTRQECVDSHRYPKQSNTRYKDYNQTHFTPGDEQQFKLYMNSVNGKSKEEPNDLSDNVFGNLEYRFWNKNAELNAKCVLNTFRYMFNKFKKGIFIQIRSGKLSVFLPFSKKNFINEWSYKIKINPKYGEFSGFIKYIKNQQGKKFNPKYINRYFETWYSNNCLVRYEYPLSEGDTNVSIMSNMFETLCEERKVPDMEFFVNRRDFPLIKTDSTEPYDHIYDSDTKPLLSHNYEKYSPILSMVNTENYSDLTIPTGDDWARINKDKHFFKQITQRWDFSEEWDNKKPIAVFRGSTTGAGTSIKNNMRLKVAYLNQDGILDAGITKWNTRPRKIKGHKYLETINIEAMTKLGIKLKKPLTLEEQSKYKYIINIEGHVSAFRLSKELNTGSCILLTESRYKLWFSDLLKPYIHYIPIKKDLSDLIDKIKWCRSHDNKCREISQNAKKFYNKFLTKNGILDYLQNLLVKLKQHTGSYFYNSKTPLEIQLAVEKRSIQSTNKFSSITEVGVIPRDQNRSYGILRGLEWIYQDVKNFSGHIKNPQKIYENKSTRVTKYTFCGFPIVIKKCLVTEKINENIHEAFVGIRGINEVVKYIPNFAYIFGYEDKTQSVIMEYVGGKSMEKWIVDEFNIDDYLTILIQLSLALETAQNICGFIHWDLTPWNIIIQKLKKEIVIDYMLDDQNIYQVKTKIIPVIIDYGKSHIIHKNIHYGLINMFKTSSIQDVISLIITSLYNISLTNLTPDKVSDIITISNFVTGTKYMNKISKSGKNGLGGLRYLFGKAKKYTNITTSNKYELETLRPRDFINYIKNKFRYTNCKKILKPNFLHNQGNSLQVYEYIIAKNDEEREKSYIEIFERFLRFQIQIKKYNIFINYYILKIFQDNLESVYKLKKNNQEIQNLYLKCLDKLKLFKNEINSKGKIKEFVKIDTKIFKQEHVKIEYDDETFNILNNVEKLINVISNQDIYPISNFILLLWHIDLTELSIKDREYAKNYLIINPTTIRSRNADIKTIKYMYKKIKQENLKKNKNIM